jgi:hypothetical protein
MRVGDVIEDSRIHRDCQGHVRYSTSSQSCVIVISRMMIMIISQLSRLSRLSWLSVIIIALESSLINTVWTVRWRLRALQVQVQVHWQDQTWREHRFGLLVLWLTFIRSTVISGIDQVKTWYGTWDYDSGSDDDSIFNIYHSITDQLQVELEGSMAAFIRATVTVLIKRKPR